LYKLIEPGDLPVFVKTLDYGCPEHRPQMDVKTKKKKELTSLEATLVSLYGP
jgi:hypothetical protein